MNIWRRFQKTVRKKYFSRYKGSKSENSIDSLWKVQTKKAKKDYFFLQFLSNLIQIFTVYSLLNFKSFECRNFVLRKTTLFSKMGNFGRPS